MIILFATLVLIVAQLFLPLRYAYVPLLLAAFHLSDFEVVNQFTPIRLVLIVGLIRAVTRGFFQWSSSNKLDLMVLFFAGVAMLSSLGHVPNNYVPNPWMERIGLCLNICGSYLYARAYFQGPDFLYRFSRVLVLIIVPFSILISLEQVAGRNIYGAVGLSQTESSITRNDRFRAQGTFGHAIIAGTAAATTLPFMVLLYRRKDRKLAIVGGAAAVMGALASASSGPLLALVAGVSLMMFWRWRHWLHTVKIAILVMLVVLNFTMSRPIWFLIARIDIVGGSTGWHRSILIDRAMTYINEWWLAGTDHTRHWIHSGVTWNPNHTDITNYYLQMCVLGGLPLLIAFVLIIYSGLKQLERQMAVMRLELPDDDRDGEFAMWCVWTAIFMHCLSFISIAYFDQAYSLFFGLLGAIPALVSGNGSGRDYLDEEAENESDTRPHDVDPARTF
jgi:TRAP-type mannitol/chloroaromatic compound transport system permease small subunit